MKNQRPSAPWRVTLSAALVLLLTVWNALRLVETLRQWEALQSLSPAPPVGYLLAFGLVWSLSGAALTWGLVYAMPWARRGTQIAALLYTVWYWIDRLLVADSATIAARWPFACGLTLALLAFTFWALSTPPGRAFFTHEHSI